MSDIEQMPQTSLSETAAPLIDVSAPAEIAQIVTAEAERVVEEIGDMAEETLDQGQAAVARVQETAAQATSELEAAVAAVGSTVSDINLKAFGVIKASADAALDYFSALANAKTLPDVVAAQTELMRRQIATMNEQTHEFAKLAEDVSARSISPLNQTFASSFGAAV
jgi:hypothetical protein